LSISQIRLGVIFLLPFVSIFFIKNRFFYFLSSINNFFIKEIKPLFGNNYHLGSLLVILRILNIILISNIQGLFSYTFTWSSHLLFSLSYGLPLWFSILLIGLINNINKNLRHLVPNGTPVILIRFIVLIERLRILIRPITLRVRLAANITAGHLLLSLIRWSDKFYIFNFFTQLLIFF
jgi:F-type H+-transporting ATPase subunit a